MQLSYTDEWHGHNPIACRYVKVLLNEFKSDNWLDVEKGKIISNEHIKLRWMKRAEHFLLRIKRSFYVWTGPKVLEYSNHVAKVVSFQCSKIECAHLELGQHMKSIWNQTNVHFTVNIYMWIQLCVASDVCAGFIPQTEVAISDQIFNRSCLNVENWISEPLPHRCTTLM